MTLATTLRFNDVAVGDTLPPLTVPITVTGIVSCAIATRDYQNVHHDLEATRALGSPHIFMNILTSNGMVERFIQQWTGPEVFIRGVSIRLGAPNYPGDTMVIKGQVTALDPAERLVTVEVKGNNALGPHVTGTVRLVLPA